MQIILRYFLLYQNFIFHSIFLLRFYVVFFLHNVRWKFLIRTDMNIQQIIKQHHLELLFQQGSFGIEKESQRVHSDGSIVTSLHPKVLVIVVSTLHSNRFCRKSVGIGDSSDEKIRGYITLDFSYS